ncbi:MAG: branched-chain amino acid ABC transporter permease [Armatimonadota bacterium]
MRSWLRRMRQPLWGAAAMLVLAGLFLAAVRELFVLQVMTFVFIFAIYAQSWNLVAHSGQFSLGHAAFLGVGGYASALLSTRLGISPAFSILLGPLLSAAVGLGIGALCRRLREVYLGMVTFGCTAIIQVLVVEPFGWLTNRWDGLNAPRLVPEGIAIERTADLNYLISVTLMVGTYFLVAAIMRSKAGLAFVALHDNEVVAAAAGVNVVRYRLLAMTLGGYLGGLAGALNSHTLTRHIEPGIFGLADSIWPMVYTIAGGLGTAEGPIIGTFVVRVFWEWALRRLGGFESLILVGMLLAVVVVALPRGIYPVAARAVTRAAEGLAARRARLPQRQP